MIAKVHALGRSFAGVAAYCLHDAPERNEGERPETAERVEWADTRNLASRPERAAAQMAATAKAAPELKRLAGVSAAGRKLEKPVLHYTLSWGKDERPDRAEMNRAAEETLKALGLKRHQALIVAHRDKDHPHLHMIANRVNPETGKAAKLGNDRLKLSRWAERWERERGQVKCPERAKNNAERAKGGQFVRDRKSLHTARHRRERMRKAGPVREVGPRVWLHKPAHLEKWATMEREAFRQYQQARGPVLEALARAHGSGSTTPTRRSPPSSRRVMCTAGRTWRRTGPPSVCRPWSGRSAKPPGRHRLNGCPIEARAETEAAASSADFPPTSNPSGARDRTLEALLRPVSVPEGTPNRAGSRTGWIDPLLRCNRRPAGTSAPRPGVGACAGAECAHSACVGCAICRDRLARIGTDNEQGSRPVVRARRATRQ